MWRARSWSRLGSRCSTLLRHTARFLGATRPAALTLHCTQPPQPAAALPAAPTHAADGPHLQSTSDGTRPSPSGGAARIGRREFAALEKRFALGKLQTGTTDDSWAALQVSYVRPCGVSNSPTCPLRHPVAASQHQWCLPTLCEYSSGPAAGAAKPDGQRCDESRARRHDRPQNLLPHHGRALPARPSSAARATSSL